MKLLSRSDKSRITSYKGTYMNVTWARLDSNSNQLIMSFSRPVSFRTTQYWLRTIRSRKLRVCDVPYLSLPSGS
jgi:hypothetical protein